jgi:hypothetical protein
MNTPDIIFLSVAVVGSIAFSIETFVSRRRIYDTWAKIASVFVCIFGLSWAVTGFLLPHFAVSSSTHTVLIMMQSFCCGVSCGLLLSIVIARPYKKVTHEKLQPLA